MRTKDEVLKEYINYKRLSVNPLKLKDTENCINHFITYDKTSLDNYSEKILINYLNEINKKYAVETMNGYKAFIKNFIKWYFVDWSSRFRNLDKLCRSQKAEATYKPEDMITITDFEKLISAEPSIFWKAYFVTLFYGCCRPVEVCNLKWKDIEFTKEGEAYFNIYSKKNKRTFLKYLPKESAYYLKQIQNNNSDYVFYMPERKKLLTRQEPYFRITQLSKRALNKKIDLYTLRHSIATINYNKEGIKDDIIAQQLGHSKSMKSTYTHNDREKLKSNAKKIYVGELPPEQKNELIKRVAVLEEQNKLLFTQLEEDKNSFQRMKVLNDGLVKSVRKVTDLVEKHYNIKFK